MFTSSARLRTYNLNNYFLPHGFKLGNKYAIFNGDLNQTQLSPNQAHNRHVGWPICAPLWLAIHAQNIILKPTLIPSNFRFGPLCLVLPNWDRSKGYLINQMDLNNWELDQSQDHEIYTICFYVKYLILNIWISRRTSCY